MVSLRGAATAFCIVTTVAFLATQTRKGLSKLKHAVTVSALRRYIRVRNLGSLRGPLALDIGGTLAKLVFLQPHKTQETALERDRADSEGNFLLDQETYGSTGQRYGELEFECAALKGTLHFVKFASHRMEAALDMVREAGILDPAIHSELPCSGGGAFKYHDLVKQQLGLEVAPVDELESAVMGVQFLFDHGPPDEVFMLNRLNFSDGTDPVPQPTAPPRPSQGPFLVANLGSGVSLLKVSWDGSYKRCGGTSQGGATFWGLCRMLTDAPTFEAAMQLCHEGDSTNVDKLVQDIYGGDYKKHNLPGTLVAASFGKLASLGPEADVRGGRGQSQADIARSLLMMITQQIAQLSFHIARAQGCSSVVFVGGFLRNNLIAQRILAYYFEYFGARAVEEDPQSVACRALFMRHADFLGAIGALAQSVLGAAPPPLGTSASFRESPTSQDANVGNTRLGRASTMA